MALTQSPHRIHRRTVTQEIARHPDQLRFAACIACAKPASAMRHSL